MQQGTERGLVSRPLRSRCPESDSLEADLFPVKPSDDWNSVIDLEVKDPAEMCSGY